MADPDADLEGLLTSQRMLEPVKRLVNSSNEQLPSTNSGLLVFLKIISDKSFITPCCFSADVLEIGRYRCSVIESSTSIIQGQNTTVPVKSAMRTRNFQDQGILTGGPIDVCVPRSDQGFEDRHFGKVG